MGLMPLLTLPANFSVTSHAAYAFRSIFNAFCLRDDVDIERWLAAPLQHFQHGELSAMPRRRQGRGLSAHLV